MSELADEADLKSVVGSSVRVQVPLSAPKINYKEMLGMDDRLKMLTSESLMVSDSVINSGLSIDIDKVNMYELILNLRPEKIIFHPPETIVYWADGEKTVVKISEKFQDKFDKEYGLAMAYMRKIFGSREAFKRTVRGAERNIKP